MHSNDSLWGCDGEEQDTVAPLNDIDSPQPPETWLMLEFCDRGSLLVSVSLELSFALATSSLHLQDLSLVHSTLYVFHTCHVGYRNKCDISTASIVGLLHPTPVS